MSLVSEAEVKIDTNKYNEATIKSLHLYEVYNAGRNVDKIVRWCAEGKGRDIADEPKVKQKSAIIVASGGSLDVAMPHLKGWEGGIFCTTSHARTLAYHGIIPTHILALDPFCVWSEVEGIDWSKHPTKLITTPVIDPSLVGNWPNEMLLYRPSLGRRTFYSTTLDQMYVLREGLRNAKWTRLIRTEIPIFACSPPAQLLAANLLGYDCLFLCGCDFGFTYNRNRFTEMVPDGAGGWKEVAHPLSEDPPSIVSNNGIPSVPMHIYYKKNMLTAWRLCLADAWTTDHGTVTEMEYADIRAVVKRQGRHFHRMSRQQKIDASEYYLATLHGYCIETTAGVMFVDAPDVEIIPAFIAANINREYRCPVCGALVTAQMDADATGKECPNCHRGKMERRVWADVEDNMKRIRKRKADVERRKQ